MLPTTSAYDSELEKQLARIVVNFAKFVDRDLESSHWQAMIFRHHILSIIEDLIKMEGGAERDFYRLPTHLHEKWRGTNAKSEQGVWGISRTGSCRGSRH